MWKTSTMLNPVWSLLCFSSLVFLSESCASLPDCNVTSTEVFEPLLRSVGHKVQEVAEGVFEIQVFVEHKIPIDAFWIYHIDAGDEEFYEVPLRVPEDRQSIVTMPVRHGVNVSEISFILDPPQDQWRRLFLYVDSKSGLERAYWDLQLPLTGNIEPEPVEYEGLGVETMQTPPSLLELQEGQEEYVVLTMRAHRDFIGSHDAPSYAMVWRYDITEKTDNANSLIQQIFTAPDEGEKDISLGVTAILTATNMTESEPFATVMLKIHFQNFKAKENSGQYCLRIVNSLMRTSVDVGSGACVDVVPASQELYSELIKPRVHIESCFRSQELKPTKNLVLYKNVNNCIKCVAVGRQTEQVQMSHRGRIIEPEYIYSTPLVSHAFFTILDANEDDAGMYRCGAYYDHGGFKSRSVTAVITEPLNITVQTDGWKYENDSIVAECSADESASTGPFFTIDSNELVEYPNDEVPFTPLQSGSTPCYNIVTTTTGSGDAKKIYLDLQLRPDAPTCTYDEYYANATTYTGISCFAENTFTSRTKYVHSVENLYGPCCKISWY